MEGERLYRIDGLDCAEEVKVLRRELGPLVGDGNLRFEVLEGRLAVLGGAAKVPEPAILAAVARTGMRALPASTTGPRTEGARLGTRLRAGLCTASGLLLLTAGAVEWAARGGWLAAMRAEALRHRLGSRRRPRARARVAAVRAGGRSPPSRRTRRHWSRPRRPARGWPLGLGARPGSGH